MTERHAHEWVEAADGTAECIIDGCHLRIPPGYDRSQYMTELQKEWLRTSYVAPRCGELKRCGRMVSCALTEGHEGKHQGEPDGGGTYLCEWDQSSEWVDYTRRASKAKNRMQRSLQILAGKATHATIEARHGN